MEVNRKAVFYVLAMAAVVIYGTVGAYILGQSGNFSVTINSWITALYFTVVTISTVGYGDITPITEIGRIFVIILIISGLSIFLSAVTTLSSDFLSARVERMYSGLNNVNKKKMRNHIVLVGYDSANEIISHKLKAQHRNFIIITADKPTAEMLRRKGYPAFLEDYTSRSELEKFNLDKATDIVIDLRDSSKVVYVVLVIKKIAKNARISAIAHTIDAEFHLKDLEIDNIISPITIAADMLTKVLDKDQDSAYGTK